MAGVKVQVNTKRWAPHLAAAAKSGQSIARYARERGLSRHTLYAARQALAAGAKGGASRRVPAGFAAVRLLAQPSALVSARLANGIELRFEPRDAAGLEVLLRLLAVL
jgi:hypothetical protein